MTPNESTDTGLGAGNRRQRKRLRGMLSGKTGKTIGFTSLAVPVIGFVLNDLKKPDSVVRGLIGVVVRKLLPAKLKKVEAIDVTDEIEILEDNSDRINQYDSNDGK